MRESGFFSYEEIEMNGTKIHPIDITAKLLFPKWKLKEGEEDFTIMRIVIEGLEKGNPKKYTYNLLDRYDKETQTISMARTTGYTCTAVANLILEGKFSPVGVNAPEAVGMGGQNLAPVLNYLEERNVHYKITSS